MGLLAVIGITYSVIAPLVSGFALIAFVFFWFVYKVSRINLVSRNYRSHNTSNFFSTSSFTFTINHQLERQVDYFIQRPLIIFSSVYTLNNYVWPDYSSSLKMKTRSNLLSLKVRSRFFLFLTVADLSLVFIRNFDDHSYCHHYLLPHDNQ